MNKKRDTEYLIKEGLIEKMNSILYWEPDYEEVGFQVGPSVDVAYDCFKEIRRLDKSYPIPNKLRTFVKENGTNSEIKEITESEYVERSKTLPIIWKTIDNKKLKISNMEISHIKNCINMLEKQLVKLKIQEQDNLMDFIFHNFEDEIQRKEDYINAFKSELKRRK